VSVELLRKRMKQNGEVTRRSSSRRRRSDAGSKFRIPLPAMRCLKCRVLGSSLELPHILILWTAGFG